MQIKSISLRIWLTFTVIITIIISSISFTHFYTYTHLNITNQKSDLLTIHNILLEQNFEDKVRFSDFRNLRDSAHFVVIEDEVIELTTSPKNQKDQINPFQYEIKKEISKFAKGHLENAYFKENIQNSEYMFYITSIGQDYFISYMPLLNEENMLVGIILLGCLFILGGLFASIIVSKTISKPLKELEQFTTKIAKKDFSSTIDIQTEDEIGSLAHSMLRMQEELKKVDIEEKQFLQSISHDLKTPVSVIIAHADSIIDGVYIDNVENTAEIIKNEAINLNKKIKKLLYFNTLDFTLENEEEIENVNLKELLFNMSSRFKFSNPDLSWELDLDNVTMDVDYDKLSVSIENIIDNALRYAKKTINISLKQNENSILIKIFNDGEQISEEAIDKIFRNLYKHKKGNFGLGLAISKKIINHYQGEVKAENMENGVIFTISFPLKNEEN